MTLHYDNQFQNYLENRRNLGLCRTLPVHNAHKNDISFASNDYLCLSKDLDVLRAAQRSLKTGTMGAGSVRLLMTKGQEELAQIEDLIAQSLAKEGCLIFGNSYMLNSTVIPALANLFAFDETAIIFDRLCHESILRGCLSSKRKFSSYQHNDYDHLEGILKSNLQKGIQYQFIFTESVFSMDGDLVNFVALDYLKKKYNAFLYIDEAHAVGVYGDRGYGLASKHPSVDVIVGTFGKAVGCYGGYIACSKLFKEYLINACGGLIYSTCLPFVVLKSVEASWQKIPQFNNIREKIHHLADYLRSAIQKLGYSTLNSNSHIVPLHMKSSEKMKDLHADLRKNGCLTSYIRPPTVSRNTARLRMCINASHTHKQLDYLLNCISAWR